MATAPAAFFGRSVEITDQDDLEDQVADELVEHVGACLASIKASPWWDFLGVSNFEPTREEIALCLLGQHPPQRGTYMAWDALICVVRAMVLKRVGTAG
jgi:hypothetical protein